MNRPRILQNLFFVICYLGISLGLNQCKSADHEKNFSSKINTAHLDALYEETIVDNKTVGIVHIYSEYPEYKWKGDDNEGIACVDDASRAAIFYLRQYKTTADPEYLRKAKMLLKFLLAMQSANGYYYNFIWTDGRINTDGHTSKAEPDWWSWRTLLAFGEAINTLDPGDLLIPEIHAQREILIRNILREDTFKSTSTDTAMGMTIPTWLPKGSGTDQASIVLLGLTWMLQQPSEENTIPKDSLLTIIRHFADGIIMMQVEEPDSLQDGAFLSWENLWHAYGNIQAYALMTTGEEIYDPHMISHGLYEVDHFYPSILKVGGLEHFWIQVKDGKLVHYDSKVFSQIAYGRSPMILAALKAYDITKDEKYLTLAKELAAWFSGQNPAKTPMYDPSTGRGFDGISSPEQINKNAGAESTIESLLSLQVMEKYK